MKTLNFFAPDSLEAAITPLIVGPGNDPWTNNNFVASDIGIHGLQGGAFVSQKFLDTGVNPSTTFGLNSGGITLYNTTANETSTEHETGVWINGVSLFDLTSCYSVAKESFFDCWTTVSRVSTNRTDDGRGYVSGNRTGAGDIKLYIARSDMVPNHQNVAGGVGAPGLAPPNHTLPVFCVWDAQIPPPAYRNWTTKRLSFFAVHEGLTESESEAFFGLVQALRTAFGGGYV